MSVPAPGIATDPAPVAGAIVVFDGVRVLCNGWVGLLLRHDRRARCRFAAMQGEAGRRLLAAHGLDPDDPVSFLPVEYDRGAAPRISTGATGVRRVLIGLGGVWRLAAVSALLPSFVREPLYRGIARNRHRRFGRHDVCRVPDPAAAHRFL